MPEKFHFFWNGQLSQWYPSEFEIADVMYTCAEQYMMAAKARMFKDQDALKQVMLAPHPRIMKAIGRTVKNFDHVKWDNAARDVVYAGNMAKFTQCKQLYPYLVQYPDRTIVEASPYDTLWGIGLDENHPLAQNRGTWCGKNWLGEVLTVVRDHLLAGDESVSSFQWSQA